MDDIDLLSFGLPAFILDFKISLLESLFGSLDLTLDAAVARAGSEVGS